MMTDDLDLLRQYAADQSETAFETLVGRYVNLVYSAAVRQVNDPHLAEEVVQAVFIILARKAGSLGPGTILPSWLHRTACFVAADALKRRRRRERREQEAHMESQLNESPAALEETWRQMAPLLDTAIAGLNEKDRHAIVLRFFENQSLADVGRALGANEDAARMRINRALEKLRQFFTRRDVVSTTAIIAGAMAANSIQAAPAMLAKSVTAVAVAKGAAATGSTLTLIQGALKIMAWTKVKTAVLVGAGLLAAGGTATVCVQEAVTRHRDSLWQVSPLDMKVFDRVPPMVRIVPTKFPPPGGSLVTVADGRSAGLGWSLSDIMLSAHGYSGREVRLVPSFPPDGFGTNRYDFITSFRSGGREALQQELRRQFGLAGRIAVIETNVCLLRVKRPNHPGLKPPQQEPPANNNLGPGRVDCTGADMSWLALYLENKIGIPVLDQTQLTSAFGFTLTWDEYGPPAADADPAHPRLAALRQALPDQLGLELVPSREPIQMLVVEKVR